MSRLSFLIRLIVSTTICFGMFSCGGGAPRTTEALEDEGSTLSTTLDALQVIGISDSLLVHRKADTIKMGRVFSGETVVHSTKLVNTGDKPFVIVGLNKTCGCLDIEYPRTPLKPGESARMDVSFDSRGLTGWTFKTIGITTSLSSQHYILVVTADVE